MTAASFYPFTQFPFLYTCPRGREMERWRRRRGRSQKRLSKERKLKNWQKVKWTSSATPSIPTACLCRTGWMLTWKNSGGTPSPRLECLSRVHALQLFIHCPFQSSSRQHAHLWPWKRLARRTRGRRARRPDAPGRRRRSQTPWGLLWCRTRWRHHGSHGICDGAASVWLQFPDADGLGSHSGLVRLHQPAAGRSDIAFSLVCHSLSFNKNVLLAAVSEE